MICFGGYRRRTLAPVAFYSRPGRLNQHPSYTDLLSGDRTLRMSDPGPVPPMGSHAMSDLRRDGGTWTMCRRPT